MKTKNIFRTLLVAAALLMGANNVKAETRTTIFSDNNAQAYNYIWFEFNAFKNAQANDELIVSYTPVANAQSYSITFNGVINQNVDGNGTSTIIKLTPEALASINTTNPGAGSAYMQGSAIAITEVVLVTGGGGSTTESGELVDVNLGYYDYRTYVTPYVIDFSRSVGVEGYYAKEVSGNNIVFYQVTGKCASGVPLLLKKTDSASKLWKVTDTSVSGTTPDPNLLVAGNQTSPTVSGNNIYVLTYHNGGYVFAETEFQSADVDNQHAYLDLNSVNSGNARAYSIRFVKGNTTGINDIKAETIDSNVIYDLRGQRVERPTKGIYIINGKKVMIK